MDEENDAFYEELERQCRYNMLMIVDDLNAKIEKEAYIKHIAEKETIYSITIVNGDRI